MNRLVLGLLVACVMYSGGAFAVDTGNCKRPQAKPAVPLGATATDEQMVAANSAVRKYVDEGQTYLTCLKRLQETLPKPAAQPNAPAKGEHAKDATDELVDLYNAVFDEMSAVTEKYNEAVRAHKASSKK